MKTGFICKFAEKGGLLFDFFLFNIRFKKIFLCSDLAVKPETAALSVIHFIIVCLTSPTKCPLDELKMLKNLEIETTRSNLAMYRAQNESGLWCKRKNINIV